jgi:hypothetical protein
MMTGILMVSVMVGSFSCVEGQPTTASATTTATTTAADTIVGISDSIGGGYWLGGGIFYDNNNSYNRGEKCFYCIFFVSIFVLQSNLFLFCFILLQIKQIKQTSLGGVLWRRAATRMTSCNSFSVWSI